MSNSQKISDCVVCFCPIEDEDENTNQVFEAIEFTCADPACTAVVCMECMEALINYSSSEKIIPSCPSKTCNAYFIQSHLKALLKSIIKKYQQSCLDYFIKDSGEQVKKKIQQEEILKKIRKERMKFIVQSFPIAISVVASITFSAKLKRLEKQKMDNVSKKVDLSNKVCFNMTCNGFLDGDYECMTCITRFCKICETKLKESESHKCKEDDIESVKMISKMIKCPNKKCALPVFKDEGCDSIKCSNCGTNFLYSTGKEGGHGSTNAKINIQVQHKQKLTNEFKGTITEDLLHLLFQIEAIEPTVITSETLLGPIRLYYKTNNVDVSAKQLAKRLDSYINNRYQRKSYIRATVEIEDLIRNKTATTENLDEILKKLMQTLSITNTIKSAKSTTNITNFSTKNADNIQISDVPIIKSNIKKIKIKKL